MTKQRRAAIVRKLERIIHITHIALFFAAGALLLALWGLNGATVIAAVAVLFVIATLLGKHAAKPKHAAARHRERTDVPVGQYPS